jgi:superfamily II DNA or RNA helicase
MFEAGDQVRLVEDPTRVGVIRKGTQMRGDEVWYRVQFADGVTNCRGSNLELIPDKPEDPLTFLEQGQFADIAALRRALTHVRLTGRLSDVIYSMEATNTEFYAYQFKPVLKLLQSPVGGLLIADEVGLGKTIEAGLIWTELRSRLDLSRLLVVCPAPLREKWQQELRRRFGVSASIEDAAGVGDRLAATVGTREGFAMIASIQGLRPPRDWDEEDPRRARGTIKLAHLLQAHANTDPLVDLLVIDEAHHLRNPETQTNELGQLLRHVAAHVILLSATPIHNKNNDLLTLLKLIDENIVAANSSFEEILLANRPLIHARDHLLKRATPDRALLAATLSEAMSHRLLRENRQLTSIRETLLDTSVGLDEHRRSELAWQLDSAHLLGSVLTRTRKRDVTEHRVIREPKAEFVPMTDAERECYDRVTEIVRKYSEGRLVNEKFLLVMPQRLVSSCMPAAVMGWLRGLAPDEDGDTIAWRPTTTPHGKLLGPLTEEIAIQIRGRIDIDSLVRSDSKYARLRSALKEFLREHPDDKVVLFSSFRQTLGYLADRLRDDGIGSSILWGGGDRPKDEVIREFEQSKTVKVLLSSEVGGEGVDLQFCWVVINYDLPWNPMKVEQRIGRIDRLGQKRPKVAVWNLFYDETIDARIYQRLYEKLNLCTTALGDFEELLGEAFQSLGLDLLTQRLSPEQEIARIEQTRVAIENKRRHELDLEEKAHTLAAYGDYVVNKIQAARELRRWITPDDLYVYVREFLDEFATGYKLSHVADDCYELDLPRQLRYELSSFCEASARSARPRVVVDNPSKIVFSTNVVDPLRGEYEVISQLHPLIRFATTKVSEDRGRIRPAVAVRVRSVDAPAIPPARYVLAAWTWSAEGVQVVERLVYVAVRTDCDGFVDDSMTERLVTACIARGEHWHDASGLLDLGSTRDLAVCVLREMEGRYESFRRTIDAQNQDRADIASRSIDEHLSRQQQLFTERIGRHRAAGRKGLQRADEENLRRIEEKLRQRLHEIESKRVTRFRHDEILLGVIQVDGGS